MSRTAAGGCAEPATVHVPRFERAKRIAPTEYLHLPAAGAMCFKGHPPCVSSWPRRHRHAYAGRPCPAALTALLAAVNFAGRLQALPSADHDRDSVRSGRPSRDEALRRSHARRARPRSERRADHCSWSGAVDENLDGSWPLICAIRSWDEVVVRTIEIGRFLREGEGLVDLSKLARSC